MQAGEGLPVGAGPTPEVASAEAAASAAVEIPAEAAAAGETAQPAADDTSAPPDEVGAAPQSAGPGEVPSTTALAADVAAVLRDFRTAELAARADDGTPIAWPMVVAWQHAQGVLLTSSQVGQDRTARNARLDPRVGLLYSDPTGSGLVAAPTVLVQGDAYVPDQLVTGGQDYAAYWAEVFRRQRPGPVRDFLWTLRGRDEFVRYLVYVVPRRIFVWRADDPAGGPILLRGEPPIAPAAWMRSRLPAAPGGSAQGLDGARRVSWRTWRSITTQVPRFASAVLSTLDVEGYPFLVRCQVELVPDERALWVRLPAGLPVTVGPAGLLLHSHDERLEHREACSIRGTLSWDGAAWRFIPTRYVAGPGTETVWAAWRAGRVRRHAVRRHFEVMGMRPPRVDRGALRRIKRATREADDARRAARLLPGTPGADAAAGVAGGSTGHLPGSPTQHASAADDPRRPGGPSTADPDDAIGDPSTAPAGQATPGDPGPT